MRLGPLEVSLIITVILLILVVTRIIRASPDGAEKNKARVQIPGGEFKGRVGVVRHRLKIAGIVFIFVGIVLLLAGLSLFKWVLWSYLLSFIAIAIGFMAVFISRKR